MNFLDWALAAAGVVVVLMWIIELKELFKGDKCNIRPDEWPMGERSSAKSDAERVTRPRGRSMGRTARSQAKNEAGEPVRHGAGIKCYACGQAVGGQKMAESLSENGEGK